MHAVNPVKLRQALRIQKGAVLILSHLPVIIDPSHAAGRYALVPSISCAAVAAGADGLIIEVHNDPEHALSDGPQSLKPQVFDRLAKKLYAIHEVMKNTEDVL